MKTIKSTIKIFLLLGLFTGACEKESESPEKTQPNYIPFNYETITFTKKGETNTLNRIELKGTEMENSTPVHIQTNAATDGGGMSIGVNDVTRKTGISGTLVTQMIDGAAIDYGALLNLDGHVNVHLSTPSISILNSQGNNGNNNQTINNIHAKSNNNYDY